MRYFWSSLIDLLESINKARAATSLARAGRYEEARRIFENDNEVHP
jgi:hypothetical protein